MNRCYKLVCAAAGISSSLLGGANARAASYTVTDLGVLDSSYVNSTSWGINSAGKVVGISYYPNPNSTSIEDAQRSRAFVYDGVQHPLGTLGGEDNFAMGINSSGVIAGYSDIASGESHAYFYDGSMHDLGTLGGPNSYGSSI